MNWLEKYQAVEAGEASAEVREEVAKDWLRGTIPLLALDLEQLIEETDLLEELDGRSVRLTIERTRTEVGGPVVARVRQCLEADGC